MVKQTMNKKYIFYGLMGAVAGVSAIALAIYTGAQQSSIRHHDSPEMTHHPGSGHQTSTLGIESGSNHDHHSQQVKETAQVKLAISGNVVPNQSTPLTLAVQSAGGQAITEFETFQEKQMHLIVVSDDLQIFEHIHPNYQGQGRFTVQATFPQAGAYTLFSDYKPANQNEVVSVSKVTVPGTPPKTPVISFDRSKTINTTQAILDIPSSIQAGQEVAVTFNLKDAATDQPVKDLQPYLGEQGHLVILRQSPSLARANYIHAHALRDSATGQVRFITQFPEPGRYKLWGQFDRNGEILTADFWVNVQ